MENKQHVYRLYKAVVPVFAVLLLGLRVQISGVSHVCCVKGDQVSF